MLKLILLMFFLATAVAGQTAEWMHSKFGRGVRDITGKSEVYFDFKPSIDLIESYDDEQRISGLIVQSSAITLSTDKNPKVAAEADAGGITDREFKEIVKAVIPDDSRGKFVRTSSERLFCQEGGQAPGTNA